MDNKVEINEDTLSERGFTGVITDKDYRFYFQIKNNRFTGWWLKYEDGKYSLGMVPDTSLYYDIHSLDSLDDKLR